MRGAENEGVAETAAEPAVEAAGDEPALIASAQRGDFDAFNELVRRYQTLAFNVAARILGDRDLAADAVQDSFLSAWEHLSGFRGSSFRAWLLRIVTNRCYDRLRRQKVRQANSIEAMLEGVEATELASGEEGPEQRALRLEFVATIQ